MIVDVKTNFLFILVLFSRKNIILRTFLLSSTRGKLFHPHHLYKENFQQLIVPRMLNQCNLESTNVKSEMLKLGEWIDLDVRPEELRPNLTLRMGQCFNWRKLVDHEDHQLTSNVEDESAVWVGVLDSRAIAIRQMSSSTGFLSLNSKSDERKEDMIAYLRDYFELKHSLKDLYQSWSDSCPRMKIVCSHLPGVRVVRQDPWECLVSFICSSCNNIKRITQMLDSLRCKYGNYLCTVAYQNGQILVSSDKLHDESTRSSTRELYSFPGPEILSSIAEDELRQLGFGKYCKIPV